MAFSCPRGWHAPFYLAISVILAIIVISTSFHAKPKTQFPLSPKPDSRNPRGLSLGLNASRALRRSGFNVMATLLEISPLLLLPSPELTIFAIQDPPISNISLQPLLTRDLLRYHTSPSKLSMEDLLKKPQGSCISTLLPGKQLTVTKVNGEEGKIEINRVLITHPDIFVKGSSSIHGVLEPFVQFAPEDIELERSPIESAAICNSNSSLVTNVTQATKGVPWTRILRSLGSNGFVSFAIGLQSILDGILKEYGDLSSVTIFAPPELIYVASPLPLLERIVKLHISPQLFTYRELASLPEKASLRTLVPGQDLEITKGFDFTGILAINNVEINVPDAISSKGFVIHGISRAFEMAKVSTTSS